MNLNPYAPNRAQESLTCISHWRTCVCVRVRVCAVVRTERSIFILNNIYLRRRRWRRAAMTVTGRLAIVFDVRPGDKVSRHRARVLGHHLLGK